MQLHKADDSLLFSVAYEYDDAGNRTAVTYTGDHPMVGRHAYTYDALNRLLTASHPQPGPLPDEFYTYDAVGNRLTSHRSSAYHYDAANRLLDDDTFTYTFDAAGWLTQRKRKSNNAIMTLFRGAGFQPILSFSQFTMENGSVEHIAFDSLLRRGSDQMSPFPG